MCNFSNTKKGKFTNSKSELKKKKKKGFLPNFFLNSRSGNKVSALSVEKKP